MNSCSGMGQLVALRSLALFVFLSAEFCLDQVHNGGNFLLNCNYNDNSNEKLS